MTGNLTEDLTGVFIQFYQQFNSALKNLVNNLTVRWDYSLTGNLTEDLTGVWEYL